MYTPVPTYCDVHLKFEFYRDVYIILWPWLVNRSECSLVWESCLGNLLLSSKCTEYLILHNFMARIWTPLDYNVLQVVRLLGTRPFLLMKHHIIKLEMLLIKQKKIKFIFSSFPASPKTLSESTFCLGIQVFPILRYIT